MRWPRSNLLSRHINTRSCNRFVLLPPFAASLLLLFVRFPFSSAAAPLSIERVRERSGLTMKKKLRRSDLHTTTFNSSSSSNKFGSFILLASANKYARLSTDYSTEDSFIMLSSSSSSSVSESDESGDWPWRYDDGKVFRSKDQLFKVDLDNEEEEEEDQQLVVVLKSLGVPLFNESTSCFNEIIGSCEGLVCLFDNKNKSNLLCLWNPATKTHRILPKPEPIGVRNHLFAFGFDVETKDYKVVLLTGLSDREAFYRPISPIECICRVQVYSLSTDSWRLLEGITCLPGDPFGCSDDEGVLYLNGSCFFLAQFFHTRHQPCFPESNRFIISFDFTKEIITPIQLPDHHLDQMLYLSSLGDEMALFTKSYHNAGTCEDYNVWVLKEHNGSSSIRSVNKESWTNLHSFRIEGKSPFESNTPIGLSNDGEFALLETCGSSAFSKKIKLYHFATEEVKSFISCNRVMSKAIAYKPSLVSIIGGNGATATVADRVI